MCWLMPNDSPIGAGRAKILAGERDVHNLNFTFIVLYKSKRGGARQAVTMHRFEFGGLPWEGHFIR